MVQVALLKADKYDEKELKEIIRRGMALLGLGEGFFRGEDVLLKPNLLAPSPVERAVCSHPAVVGAVASLALEQGGRVKAGDSPGLGSVNLVARSCGLDGPLARLGVPLVSLEEEVKVSCPQGKVCRSIPLARPVVEAGKVVSLARLKTHGLTFYTGAAKNLYGCIPGRQKQAFHLRYNEIDNFHRMLADLVGAIRPALALVDGIVSMEGPGPRRGNPRQTGFLVLSQDAVAADVVACRLVGIDPERVLYLKYAGEAGSGVFQAREIEVVGEREEDLKVDDFQLVGDSYSPTGFLPAFLARLLRDLVVPLPRVNRDKCQACGICQDTCPAGVIEVGSTVKIDYQGCIRCYCCQELCPHEAIDLKKSLRPR